MRQSGTLINALVVLAVTVVIALFVIRPLTRAILTPPAAQAGAAGDALLLQGTGGGAAMALEDGTGQGMGAAAGMAGGMASPVGGPDMERWSEANLIEDLTSRPRRSPQKRLEQMIEFDEEQAAAVLKQWIHKRAAA